MVLERKLLCKLFKILLQYHAPGQFIRSKMVYYYNAAFKINKVQALICSDRIIINNL